MSPALSHPSTGGEVTRYVATTRTAAAPSVDSVKLPPGMILSTTQSLETHTIEEYLGSAPGDERDHDVDDGESDGREGKSEPDLLRFRVRSVGPTSN